MGDTTAEALTLGEILDSTEDGVFVLDANRRFIMFNKACERLTGWPAEEIIGTGCRCSSLNHCKDRQGRSLAGLLCPGLAVFEGRLPALRQRMHIQSRTGESRWVETQYTTLRDADGRPRCIIGVMRDDSDTCERERGWRQTIEDLREEVDRLRDQLRHHYGFTGLITRSPRMQTVLERIEAACSSPSPVLISGEAGAGKELIARTIHGHSSRCKGPFVPASALEIPRDRIDAELFGRIQDGQDPGGLYAAAEGGTLFLESLESLPGVTQDRLLRVLQDKVIVPVGSATPQPVNVRLIVTTRRPIQELLASGALRQDLYYRLGVLTIEVPPLRARREDIPLLVRNFLDQLNGSGSRTVHEIEPAVWAALSAYDWPGNIRELYGVIEAAFAVARDGCLRPENLRFTPRVAVEPTAPDEDVAPLDERLADIERRTILTAIRQAGGRRNLAARLMGISRSRLYRRMEALGIDPDRDRP